MKLQISQFKCEILISRFPQAVAVSLISLSSREQYSFYSLSSAIWEMCLDILVTPICLLNSTNLFGFSIESTPSPSSDKICLKKLAKLIAQLLTGKLKRT